MQARSKKSLAFVSLSGLIGLLTLLFVFNTSFSSAQEAGGGKSSPHLFDLMYNAMQLHHTKLGLAGHAGNWTLAAYEVRKVKETVEDFKEAIVGIQNSSPQWRNASINEIFSRIGSDLNSLDQAVQAKDADKFATSYRQLTATCNGCHVSLGYEQIKIIEPRSNDTFEDQDFGGQQ